MRAVKHIKDVAYDRRDSVGKVIETTTQQQADIFNSCCFCSIGRGFYQVFDDVKNEALYLCEDHKSQFDLAIGELIK